MNLRSVADFQCMLLDPGVEFDAAMAVVVAPASDSVKADLWAAIGYRLRKNDALWEDSARRQYFSAKTDHDYQHKAAFEFSRQAVALLLGPLVDFDVAPAASEIEFVERLLAAAVPSDAALQSLHSDDAFHMTNAIGNMVEYTWKQHGRTDLAVQLRADWVYGIRCAAFGESDKRSLSTRRMLGVLQLDCDRMYNDALDLFSGALKLYDETEISPSWKSKKQAGKHQFPNRDSV